MDSLLLFLLLLNAAFAVVYLYASVWNQAAVHTLLCCICAFMIAVVTK